MVHGIARLATVRLLLAALFLLLLGLAISWRTTNDRAGDSGQTAGNDPSTAETRSPRSLDAQSPGPRRQGSSEVTTLLQVGGIKGSDGRLMIALFSDREGFPDHQYATRKHSVAVQQIDGPIRLPAVARGEYAIALFQDLDSDGELDRAQLGYPLEPYGFSNNARATFGPPAFGQAAVSLHTSEQTIRIELR